MNAFWIELMFWLNVLGLDMFLIWRKKPTISQRIHNLWPQKIDYAIMIGIVVSVWAFFGDVAGLTAIRYCVVGHLFWREES